MDEPEEPVCVVRTATGTSNACHALLSEEALTREFPSEEEALRYYFDLAP